MKVLLRFLLALLLIAVAVRADEIRLKDGTKITGTIVGFEDGAFKVQTSYGFALVRKDQIAEIIPSAPKPTPPAPKPAAKPADSAAAAATPATPAEAPTGATSAASANTDAQSSAPAPAPVEAPPARATSAKAAHARAESAATASSASAPSSDRPKLDANVGLECGGRGDGIDHAECGERPSGRVQTATDPR